MDLPRAMFLPVVAALMIYTCCSTVAAQNPDTCDAIDRMIQSASAVTCTRNPACNSTDCTSSLLSGYTFTLELLSCRDPPGVRIILKKGGAVLHSQVLDQSGSINTGIFGTKLRITIDQLDGAIGLGASLLFVLGPPSTLIPYTRIPLDTQSCSPPTTQAPSSEAPTTTTASTTAAVTTVTVQTPTTTPQETTNGPNPPTCEGFDQLTENVMQMTCSRNQECDTANCSIMNPSFRGYTLSLRLLSCRSPRPGVRLMVRNPSGTLLLDRVVDESQSGLELTPNTVLDVTLDQLDNSIGLAANVRVDIGLTTITLPILAYTTLPLDRRSCPPEGTTATNLPPSPATEGPTNGTIVVPTTSTTSSSTPGVVPTNGTVVVPTTNGTVVVPTTSTTSSSTPGVVPTNDTTVVPTTNTTTDRPTTLRPTNATTDFPTSTSPSDTTTMTDTTEPPTTDSDGKNTTCSVLAEIAANAEGFTCTADSTEPCDTVDCNLFGHQAEFVLLPCRSPAAIRLLVINQDKTVVLNETVNHSDEIAVPQLLLVLNVTLDHFGDAIGLQVEGKLSGNSFNVVKYTVIPLEKAKHCNATNEDGKDREGTKATVDPEDPHSAGVQCVLFWPLLLLSSIITLIMK